MLISESFPVGNRAHILYLGPHTVKEFDELSRDKIKDSGRFEM